MPNFPSLTSASTANVDSPTDYLKDARSDIKQNMDNVNSIITTFDGYTVTTTSEVQAYTKQQYASLNTLTPGASISWNLDDGQVSVVTLDQNSTLSNPTNKQAGATYVLIVKQPAGANYTLAFSSDYKFAGGADPTITPTNGAIDVITFLSDGTNMLGGYIQDFQ